MATHTESIVSGQLSYVVPFRVVSPGDLTVEIDSVVTALYTLQGVGANSTQVTCVFDDAPSGTDVTFTRRTNASRLTDFSLGAGWTTASLNDEFDNILDILADLGYGTATLSLDEIETLALLEATTGTYSGKFNAEAKIIANLAAGTDDSHALRKDQILAAIQDAVQDVTGLGLPSYTGNALLPLRVNAGESAVEFGTIGTDAIATSAVTLAKMANVATQKLLGRGTAGTGVPEAIGLSSQLAITAGNLTYTPTYGESSTLTTAALGTEGSASITFVRGTHFPSAAIIVGVCCVDAASHVAAVGWGDSDHNTGDYIVRVSSTSSSVSVGAIDFKLHYILF